MSVKRPSPARPLPAAMFRDRERRGSARVDPETTPRRAVARVPPGTERWLEQALEALEPLPSKPARAVPGATPQPSFVRAVTAAVLAQARGELAHYSGEELCRILAPEFPALRSESVAAHVMERVRALGRPVDRFGAEPNFLVAAQLAYAMLGERAGATEEDAFARFLRRGSEDGLRANWPGYTAKDLERLRLAYPFIPSWPDGVKTQTCPDLSRPLLGVERPLTQKGFSELRRTLAELSSIPFTSFDLELMARARREPAGKLSGTKFVLNSAIVADVVPLFRVLLDFHGMRGADIQLVGKDYSAHPLVVNVLHRVFGARVEVHEKDEDIRAAAKSAVQRAIAEAPDGKLVVKVEGVLGMWEWLATLPGRHPDLKLGAISHTTSDGRELLGRLGSEVPFDVQLMSMDPSKVGEEVRRFRYTLYDLIRKLQEALAPRPLLDHTFVVLGHGLITGPGSLGAVERMGRAAVVIDPDLEKRQALDERGVVVAGSLRELARERLVLMSCAAAETVSPADLEALAGQPGEPPAPALYFVNLSSGRHGLPWDFIEQHLVSRTDVAELGHEPITEYVLELDNGRRLTLYAVADGYVANLAFLQPSPLPYGIFTSAFVMEALGQLSHRLDEGRAPQMKACTSVKVEPMMGRRLVTLYPWEGSDGMDPAANRPLEFAAAMANPHSPVFYRVARASVSAGAQSEDRFLSAVPVLERLNSSQGGMQREETWAQYPFSGEFQDHFWRRYQDTPDPSS